jgi:CP family cyanate transporter-like MFS transporter
VRSHRLALPAGLFLAGLTLRPQLVGIGPLIPKIQADLDVTHAVAGLLGTIPVLCMGAFAAPAGRLAARIGTRRALGLATSAIAVFGLARAAVPGAALVLLLTVPVGVGMGLAGALMPAAVKERFSHRPAFATGIYVVGMNLGSGLSSAIAVPFADAAGGWRATLFLFSGTTAGLAVAWIWLTRREPAHRPEEAGPVRLPWRSGLAWRLVATFTVMSVAYYGYNAWLSDAYVEHGWSESSAGALIALLNSCQILPSIVVPWFADRIGSRRAYFAVFGAVMVVGGLGLVLLPGGAWVWAPLVGTGFGVYFPLVMTLPLDIARRPGEVAAIVGMMLGLGYGLGSTAPFVLGAVRDGTGSFDAVLWVAFGACCVLASLGSAMTRERLRRGVPAPAA